MLYFLLIINIFQLLPNRVDWQGQEHERSFDSLVRTESRNIVAVKGFFYFKILCSSK